VASNDPKYININNKIKSKGGYSSMERCPHKSYDNL
jgi:hypothetical protein